MSAPTSRSLGGFHDRFRVESTLGRGGMGEVYRAYDTLLDRTVAVKRLTAESAQAPAVERLLREARACARLTHPGIVVVHDVLRAEGGIHIVMEYLQGTSLDSLPHFPRFSTFERKIGILIRILEALHYAHGRGVVHRDVKPTNVRLLPDGTVKLLDFGIAHIAGTAALTATRTLTGTPHYASPEQLRGEESDAGTDIYSTGILAFEVLTRRRPFEGDSLATVVTKALNDPLPEMGTSFVEAFPDVERIVRRAAAKRRADRYADAEDMKNALAAFLASSREAIVALQAEVVATTERLVTEAKLLLANERTNEAVPVLESALRSNPDAEEARHLLRAVGRPAGATGGYDQGTRVTGSGGGTSVGAVPTASRAGADLSGPPTPAETEATLHANPGGAAPELGSRRVGRVPLTWTAAVIALAVGVGLFWTSAASRDGRSPSPIVSGPREPERRGTAAATVPFGSRRPVVAAVDAAIRRESARGGDRRPPGPATAMGPTLAASDAAEVRVGARAGEAVPAEGRSPAEPLANAPPGWSGRGRRGLPGGGSPPAPPGGSVALAPSRTLPAVSVAVSASSTVELAPGVDARLAGEVRAILRARGIEVIEPVGVATVPALRIEGVVELSDAGDVAGTGFLSSHAVVSLQAMETGTGAVVAASRARSPGAGVSIADARDRAGVRAVEEAVADLVDQLVAVWSNR